MDAESVKMMSVAATIVLGTAAPAIAMAIIGRQGLEMIGRNPETENAIRTTMVLAIAFVESIAIFSLVIALILKFV